MSNHQKVWSKVLRELKKRMKGIPENHIVRWSIMVTGIVLGKKAQLAAIADEMPTEAKDRSTFRRLQRFVSNPKVDAQAHFMPFAMQILKALSPKRLVLALDGSTVGKGCVTLMVGVAYQNRLLPLTWIVYKGKKGHASAQRHIQVLKQLLPLIPESAEVVLLGDGEFDNVPMVDWIETHTDWLFVIRTAKSSQIVEKGITQRIETLAEKGKVVWVEQTYFTGLKYGPLTAISCWEDEYEEPIFLISNLRDPNEACDMYEKRALIETLFSDQKSRGFQIDKSRLEDPEKITRLLVSTCLAYIWMIWLGTEVVRTGQTGVIGPTSRCDKSLFRLGKDWFKHLFKRGKEILVSFNIPEYPSQPQGVMQ